MFKTLLLLLICIVYLGAKCMAEDTGEKKGISQEESESEAALPDVRQKLHELLLHLFNVLRAKVQEKSPIALQGLLSYTRPLLRARFAQEEKFTNKNCPNTNTSETY
ncbi:uncharacterized protein LOC143465423 [Clavelina lepadiformis]|uniref:uncharacterized protein LOC143465423 n=1 Tax=Clavelina lepadiformis TaxID=159417 RepID=UPI0040417CA9